MTVGGVGIFVLRGQLGASINFQTLRWDLEARNEFQIGTGNNHSLALIERSREDPVTACVQTAPSIPRLFSNLSEPLPTAENEACQGRDAPLEKTMNNLRVDLKVCEGCGALWLRTETTEGVYCRRCAARLSQFPAPT